MSRQVLEATKLMESLPVEDQDLALQMIKKIVLARDPNFTKVTPAERIRLDKAEEEYKRGEFVEDSDEIWN